MSYVVTSGHVECLKSGRLVAPGASVPSTEAKQNPRLIERGALTEQPVKGKSKPASKSPAPEPESKPPAPKQEPEKEDQK